MHWAMSAREKAEMARFLAMVDPHTVIFSNAGAKQLTKEEAAKARSTALGPSSANT